MGKLKTTFLIALMAVAGFAQNAADLETQSVLRVAAKLKCSCGCNLNMACQMPGGCSVCKMNRTKIYQMQQGGSSDQQILDSYVAEKGKDVLVIPPGMAGFAGPYVMLGLGLIAVLWFIRRYSKKRPAMAGVTVDPATMAQIEKDMDELD